MIELWSIETAPGVLRPRHLSDHDTVFEAIQMAAWDYPPGKYVADDDEHGVAYPFQVTGAGCFEMEPRELEGLIESVPGGLALAEQIAHLRLSAGSALELPHADSLFPLCNPTHQLWPGRGGRLPGMPGLGNG